MFEILGVISLFFIGYRIYQGLEDQQSEEEYIENQDVIRKKELKNLLENREERLDFKEYNEEEFWKLIDSTGMKAKESYRNHMGLLKDALTKKTPEELIQIDNLINRLYKENLSYDVLAAANIIFKTADASAVYILFNIFITRGEVFFKNVCINPKLIIGKKVNDLDSIIISDLIADRYYSKTNKLIPQPPALEDVQISGNPFTEKDLPSRYPELWMEFA